MGCEGVFEEAQGWGLEEGVENTEEALKCWNLGHILDAELSGKKKPKEQTLEDTINEEHGSPPSSDDVVTVD